mgnify:CR=1 FL=1|jgi:hypothetical protein
MKQYELTNKQAIGLDKLKDWLFEKEKDDMMGIFAKAREKISYILIREYYSESERDLLNELRRQYFEDIKSN